MDPKSCGSWHREQVVWEVIVINPEKDKGALVLEWSESRRCLMTGCRGQGSWKPISEAGMSWEEPAAILHAFCQFDSGTAFCHTSSPRQLHRCPQKLTHNAPQPPRWVPNPHLRPDLLLQPCSSSSATTLYQSISLPIWARGHCTLAPSQPSLPPAP